MRFPVDLHTHTIASDHAYSTIEECIHRASVNKLIMFATTDHGPALSDAPHLWHFHNLRVIPRVVDNVCVLRGVEANIMSEGGLDLEEQSLKRLDIVLAGFHPCTPPKDLVKNTELMLGVIKSGLVDVISHPGAPNYPIDYEAVLECAKQEGVAMEINSSSDVNTRLGSHENCVKVAALCKKIGTTISLGTDAHVSFFMGNFAESEKVLAEAGVSDEQIINTSAQKVLRFLEGRGHAPITEMHEFLGS
ncbi:MAG: phosphatase [Succinivibrio sp.]|nr:phosphatase [Succinivibrio sp.]